jgi:hypothetical protein
VGRSRTLLRSTCKHVSPVVVNAVEGGGHRAHCLACGMVGPVRETTVAAWRAISSREGHASSWASDETRPEERQGVMRLEETRLGASVRVGQGYRKPEMRGLLGTVKQRWGNPNHHTALLVLLEDGRYELFWDHELGEVEEEPPSDRFWRRRGR